MAASVPVTVSAIPGNSSLPCENAFAVTLHDTNEIAFITRGLYVGVGGNVKVTMAGTGEGIVFTGVPSGTLLPIRVKIVWSAGTTASSIVGIY